MPGPELTSAGAVSVPCSPPPPWFVLFRIVLVILDIPFGLYFYSPTSVFSEPHPHPSKVWTREAEECVHLTWCVRSSSQGDSQEGVERRGQQTTSRMKDHLLSSLGQGQGWGVGRVYGRETLDKIPQNLCCQAHCVHVLPCDCHLRILGGDRMKNLQPRVGMSSLAHHPEPLAHLLSMLTLPRLEPPGVGETPSGHVLQ